MLLLGTHTGTTTAIDALRFSIKSRRPLLKSIQSQL